MIRGSLLSSLVVVFAVWSAEPGAAQDFDLRPDTDRGVEVVVVYLGATSCGPCRTEETKQAVREIALDMKAQQREPATKHVFVQLQGEKQMLEWLDAGGKVF